MLTTVLASVIAVIATLLGSVVTGHYQQRATDRSQSETRRRELRKEHLTAVTALAEALSAHRSMMWRRGDAKLKGDLDRYEDLRVRSHETRAAVTAPLVGLRILITDPVVRAAADRMVDATFGMRHQDTDADTLNAARVAALAAHDEFVDAAARYMQTV
ncbi:hypothetical protein [Streptomyces salinarius]|uniref:hypothetical protein n=1 Tax=Streptomyces salinarius TaxID=2762598 RepID=UPI001646E511|nr:hypothetical protein [Streptomyces salinarius]